MGDKREFDPSAPPLENFAIAFADLLRKFGLDLEYADPRLTGDATVSPAEIADQVMPAPQTD